MLEAAQAFDGKTFQGFGVFCLKAPEFYCAGFLLCLRLCQTQLLKQIHERAARVRMDPRTSPAEYCARMNRELHENAELCLVPYGTLVALSIQYQPKYRC